MLTSCIESARENKCSAEMSIEKRRSRPRTGLEMHASNEGLYNLSFPVNIIPAIDNTIKFNSFLVY